MYAAYRMDHSASDAGETPRPDGMSTLIVRVAEARDRDAFQQLFLHYGPRVRSLMLRKGANADLAEDLMQETMLSVWTKAALYQPSRGSVATWIFTIARNLRIDRLRREAVRHFDDVNDLEISETDAPDTNVSAQDDLVIASQERDLVAGALADLPAEQAEIIRLSFADDLSQSEIAERLGLPLGTVKSRMRLAYRKLRAALEDEI